MNASDRHLHAWFGRVLVLAQQHMRTYAPRLVDQRGEYTDRLVGRGELRQILGLPDDGAGAAWLDQLGVPSFAALDDARAANERAVAEAAAPELPIEVLRERFGLDAVDLDLLMVAAAPRLSVEVSRFFGVAWADFGARQPNATFLAEVVAPAHRLYPSDVLARLADAAPLVRSRLLVPRPHPLWLPDTPRTHALVEVPERVLQLLRGWPLDTTLPTGLSLHRAHENPTLNELVLDDGVAAALLDALSAKKARVRITGPRGAGRRTVVQALTGGRPLLEVRLVEALGRADEQPLADRLADVLREAQLLGAWPLLRFDGVDGPDAQRVFADLAGDAWAIAARLASYEGPIVTTEREPTPLLAKLLPNARSQIVGPPQRAGQERLWRDRLTPYLGQDRAPVVAAEMAKSERLTPAAIDKAIATIVNGHGRRRLTERLVPSELTRVARGQIEHQLGWMAETIDVRLTLADVVLPPDARERVNEVLAYARHADTVYEEWGFGEKSPLGRGLSVLFSGPPGTGKTLLAGVLAAELGRVLYRVDLSRIVDKYIGETEKNLARIFDEAERAQAVLLFDEADSLFAKRTEVKSSNDRYANLEVNFLLQKLEAYTGVSILTTNLATSLDEAFQRRLRFNVTIPMPDAPRRAELWKKLLPPRAPIDPRIDWAALGEAFVISGGHIKNAVLRAAINAAHDRVPIDYTRLADAGRVECKEIGMLVRD